MREPRPSGYLGVIMDSSDPRIEKRALSALASLEHDMVAFIQDLVRVPSLPGDEGPCQERVAMELRELGLDVELLECRHRDLRHHPAFCDDGFDPVGRIDVLGNWQGEGGPRGQGSLILNGHVDVVPTGNVSLWSSDPFSGDLRDGRIWGRGSCDMKAGLAAGLFAIAALKRAGIRVDRDVKFQSVIGEETGGLGTLAAIDHGHHAAAAVILEPTSLRLCPVQSGALTFRLETRGLATHAAAKNEGVSAIDKMRLLLEAIDQLETRRHREQEQPLYDDPTHVAPVNVGTFAAGDWHSTVPDHAVVEGRFGVFPGETVEAARESLEDALNQVCHQDTWLAEHPPRLTWVEGQFESGQTPVDHPLVACLGGAHADVTGSEGALRGVTYGSDLRLFTNHAHMPAILYGPGDLNQAHAIDESVAIEDVRVAARTMTLMLIRWCGGWVP